MMPGINNNGYKLGAVIHDDANQLFLRQRRRGPVICRVS